MKKISKIILIMAIILLAGGTALWAATQYYASEIMYNKNGTQITVEAALNELNSSIPYKVTYNANGGSGTMGVGAKYSGQSYGIAGCGFTAPDGKEFKEWNTNASGTGTSYAPGATYTANAGLTLYAIWKKIPQTFASQITTNNYGEYVDLGTTILPRTNGVITQKLGGSTPTEQPTTDWRIFHEDEYGIYLILADYLRYTHEATLGTGLLNKGSSYPYNWHSGTSRIDLIDRLNGTASEFEGVNPWNNLIASTYTAKGITVKGALDLETWIDSWNAKGYTELFTRQGSTQIDGLAGYCVETSKDPTSTSQSVSSDTAGYGNTLYFPHTVKLSNNQKYWLASPSAGNSTHAMCVSYVGEIGCNAYDFGSSMGVRPAVFIPSNIQAEKVDGVWKVDV